MGGCVGRRVAAERGTRGCEEQAADAARAATLAERRRLARELRDSVTQTLISLHLTAQAAADLWDTQPAQARAALETIRHLASGATIEMRALLVDLHDLDNDANVRFGDGSRAVAINGNKAEIKVLKEGMTGITAVTLTGGNAYVVEAKLNLRNDATKDPGPFKAFGIPYKR